VATVHNDGHEGVQRTLHRLHRDFHFPAMMCRSSSRPAARAKGTSRTTYVRPGSSSPFRFPPVYG
jgi:hypothetical protein